MTAGRKPTPIPLRRLRGNPSKRPMPAGLPPVPRKPKQTRIRVPEYLSGRAAKEYQRLARLLKPMGLFTDADQVALAGVAQQSARWIEACLEIDQHGSVMLINQSRDKNGKIIPGSGQLVPSTFLKVADAAFDRMLKGMAEFGLTPSSRARIAASIPTKDDDEVDAWERVHGQRKA